MSHNLLLSCFPWILETPASCIADFILHSTQKPLPMLPSSTQDDVEVFVDVPPIDPSPASPAPHRPSRRCWRRGLPRTCSLKRKRRSQQPIFFDVTFFRTFVFAPAFLGWRLDNVLYSSISYIAHCYLATSLPSVLFLTYCFPQSGETEYQRVFNWSHPAVVRALKRPHEIFSPTDAYPHQIRRLSVPTNDH